MRIAIGSSVLGKERNLPPYVTLLLSSSIFLKHKIKVFAYGTQNPDESIVTKIFLLPVKLIGNAFRMILFQPDVIHLNSSFNLKGLIRDIPHILVFYLLKKRVCLEFHGCNLVWAERLPELFKTLFSIWLKRVEKIFVLSSEERKFFELQWNLQNTTIVKVPIDANIRSRENSKRESGVPTLLFIGRVMETKGVSDIIKAINLLKKRPLSVIPALRIVGDGPNIDEYKMMSKQLGISSHIYFSGWVTQEQVQNEYLISDFFILPTYHQEGMPIVILYALKYSLPIITTQIRGMADNLSEPDNCLFTEPRNPKMLADKIEYLLKNSELKERMAKNNNKLADEFDKEIVAKEFVEIYKKLLNEIN